MSRPDDRRPSHARRAAGDDGAVLVEAVMVLPILLALLCGLIDFGVGMRDRQILQSAGRSAARTAAGASTYSTGRDADRFALTALWASLQNVPHLSVDRVVVFRANPASWTTAGSAALSAVPPACRIVALSDAGAGVTGGGVDCNAYSPAQVQNASAGWIYADPGTGCSVTTGFDRFWCPTQRKVGLADNGAFGPDYLGVYVQVTYTPFTQFFARTITMEDTTIVRLEPK